ncbi:MAG: ROK family protein [Lentisphaeria bacterium]|nr:ROK family protein [Lentisphaeria bacterium]
MLDTRTPILGIDVGGTKIAVCVGDSQGNILASERVHGGAQRPYNDVIPELCDLAHHVVKKAGFSMADIPVCGLSTPGPINLSRGIIEKTPNMTWGEVPIRDDVSSRLGIPAVMQNDANAGVLVEWFFGVAKGCSDVTYVTMSTGIGGGIIAAGKLVQGPTGNAGEVGHVVLDINGPLCGCGQRGCFEAFCGGKSVSKQLAELFGDKPDSVIMRLPDVNGDAAKLNYQMLREAVKDGCPRAAEFWAAICLRMAQGLGTVMNTLNPEMIILGTTFIYSGDMLMKPVKEHLPRFAWKPMLESCRFETPAMGHQIGELAGIAVALYSLFEAGEWRP